MARPGLDRNVKFRNLARLLGEPRPHVRGYLELLWEVAYENGNPVIGDRMAVEAAAEYPGEEGKLFDALLACGGAGRTGFIEPVPGRENLYQIHDLFDHAPDYVRERASREEERQKPKTCEECGTGFRSKDTRARFCSNTCRQTNYRKRKNTDEQPEGDGALRSVTDGVTDSYAHVTDVTQTLRSVTDSNGTPAPAHLKEGGKPPSTPFSADKPPESGSDGEKPEAAPEAKAASVDPPPKPEKPVGEFRPPRKKRQPPSPRKPRPPDPLFDALAEVTASDPNASGGYIGSVRKNLRNAVPPYEAADVRKFGEMFPVWFPGMAAKGPPSLGFLGQNIGRVRLLPKDSKPPPVRPVVRPEDNISEDTAQNNLARIVGRSGILKQAQG